MAKPRWVLLTRPGCHLCEEFRGELEAAFSGCFELEEACVDDRDDWRRAYGREIPVLLDGAGTPVCRSRFEAAAVSRHLGVKSPN